MSLDPKAISLATNNSRHPRKPGACSARSTGNATAPCSLRPTTMAYGASEVGPDYLLLFVKTV